MDGPTTQIMATENHDAVRDIKCELDNELEQKEVGSQYVIGGSGGSSARYSEANGDTSNDSCARISNSVHGNNHGSDGISHSHPDSSNSFGDTLNTSGLDSTTLKLKEIIEDTISSSSKQTVMKILDQVNQLSTAEKLFLYLKLPTGKNENVDPLRQPLNPLGSRFEIHQTITWIKTHLEEDQDVSLPKQDVYDEYIAYCNSNMMKPLSTADFGKVMKQVFPHVRPRRLGTRGNSRYCYAGMRKRVKLETPLLPDVGEPKKTPVHCSEGEVMSAASCLIREWAEKLLGVRFDNLRDLACHLVEKMCVDSRSVAAFTLLSTSGHLQKRDNKETTPPLGLAVQYTSKHKEAQLQLQRKLQEREVIREQKRKLQDHQQTTAILKNLSSERLKSKRAKISQHNSMNNLHSSKGLVHIKDLNTTLTNTYTQGKRSPPMAIETPISSEVVHSVCDKTLTSVPSSLGNCTSSSMVFKSDTADNSRGLSNEVNSTSAFLSLKEDSTNAGNCVPSEKVHLLSVISRKSDIEGMSDSTVPVKDTVMYESENAAAVAGKSDQTNYNVNFQTRARSVDFSIANSSDDALSTAEGMAVKPVSECGLDINMQLNLGTPLDSTNKHNVNNLNNLSTNKCLSAFSPVQDLTPGTIINDVKTKTSEIVCHDASQQDTSSSKMQKLPIPRINNMKVKKATNLIIFPSSVSSYRQTAKRYKHIQPKPEIGGTGKLKSEIESSQEDNQEFINSGVSLGVISGERAKFDCSSLKNSHFTTIKNVPAASESNKSDTSENVNVREVSIEHLEKDAFREYYHDGNNSQEQEEELMKYFQNQDSSPANEEATTHAPIRRHSSAEVQSNTLFSESAGSKSDKLSQLRLLLERNLNPATSCGRSKFLKSEDQVQISDSVSDSSVMQSSCLSADSIASSRNTCDEEFFMRKSAFPFGGSSSASESLVLLSQRSQQLNSPKKPSALLPSLLNNCVSGLSARRRVSFETPVVEDSHESTRHIAVPPSPNTRRRIFSFTPISPGPHSPNNTQQKSSKPSSANASPFVSPRNTPIPRSRQNISHVSAQLCLNSNILNMSNQNNLYASSSSSSSSHPKQSANAARIVRSNSVNSSSPSTQVHYPAPRPRALSTTTSFLHATVQCDAPATGDKHSETNSHFNAGSSAGTSENERITLNCSNNITSISCSSSNSSSGNNNNNNNNNNNSELDSSGIRSGEDLELNNFCDTQMKTCNDPAALFAMPGEALQKEAHSNVVLPLSPVSVSAPHSPMLNIPAAKHVECGVRNTVSTIDIGTNSVRKNKDILDFEPSNTLKCEKTRSVRASRRSDVRSLSTISGEGPSGTPLLTNGNVVDPLAHEVSQFFSDEQHFVRMLGNSQVQSRSQSVPLHCPNSDNTAISSISAQPSPLYIGQHNTFSFNNFGSSATSSVTPTPVPSEFTDFAVTESSAQSSSLLIVDDEHNSDTVTGDLNSENLNRIFNMLDDAQNDHENRHSAMGISISNEISECDLESACQRALQKPSRSYPNTPVPYKTAGIRDPVVTSFSTTASAFESHSNLTSRSYPSTPLIGMPVFGTSDDARLQNVNSGEDSVNQFTLSLCQEQSTATCFAERRNMSPLLDQSTFTVGNDLELDTLEVLADCDSITQLVQDVSNVNASSSSSCDI
ncbi:probable serine/threonine-protein kinase DDB_G0282963 isoform X1 [Schistocerca gregaria]|uniref:probable serine/threonine-protein kinase DDB_G0282963 isoform X1 n=2 Tax=Schistocerca gregaria TaxID=7010 RepID=UPI00211F2087|nr:probable serine/threonine-protein kinase DDB_G0282963 isoform X1 [Schistocerca gregaria]